MTTAVIVDAIRTPLGKRNGKLQNWHPVDLAAETLKALISRTGIDPAVIDDVIMGCVMQVGEQGVNIGRNAVLAAGWPDTIPGTTIDRQCGSSQQAAHFAAQGVIAGAYDVVVAAGVEVMTRVPMGSSMADGKFGFPFGPAVAARYESEGGLVGQGISAELIADKWGISRDDMDAFGVRSQEYAARATREGRFQAEILPVLGADGTMMTADEGLRDTTRESLGKLKPSFRPQEEGGRVTAGNSSQITDGSSAILIMSEEKAKALGLTPRARFVDFSLAGADPRFMLTAPIPATHKVLQRAGMNIDQMDLVEINEAFASVVLAWEKEIHPDMNKVNVNGGAIAIGHPLGCSGARLMTTLLNELERTGGRYGLQTMCEGGGMANATIIERLG
ncbi:MAG: acetyl-CoA C-acyltransferase [Ilumatobacteraceae bacterium]|nr:acetyl-CoA C-acyltransferase [Ilumatobacteraceae bacterium]MDP4702109.1 acetyl-CoA C-acyltransferase [Ilumatobacteraceae bacterium]